MKIDGPFYSQLGDAAQEARRLAAIGYDGVYTLEGSWDPFYPLVIASEHAPQLDIATGIAVAFPRNPMHLAYQAWDLQKFSQGKFMLGIGPQVKAHIETGLVGSLVRQRNACASIYARSRLSLIAGKTGQSLTSVAIITVIL